MVSYGLNLRKIEIWVLPGHQLDVPVLLRQPLENDVREVPVRDRLLHLGQQATQSRELVDLVVGVLSRRHARGRQRLLCGVYGLLCDLQVLRLQLLHGLLSVSTCCACSFCMLGHQKSRRFLGNQVKDSEQIVVPVVELIRVRTAERLDAPQRDGKVTPVRVRIAQILADVCCCA